MLNRELLSRYFEEKNFKEIKKLLLALDQNDIKTTYWWGFYYNDLDNDEYSKYQAKSTFEEIYNSGKANEYVFQELANLTDIKFQRTNILKKGLEKFPKSVELYYDFLEALPLDERLTIFDEIDDKKILSTEINLLKVKTFYELEDYKKWG
jgi:hypothetical protein